MTKKAAKSQSYKALNICCCINTNGMHHQLLEAGLKNYLCIREWIKRRGKKRRTTKDGGEEMWEGTTEKQNDEEKRLKMSSQLQSATQSTISCTRVLDWKPLNGVHVCMRLYKQLCGQIFSQQPSLWRNIVILSIFKVILRVTKGFMVELEFNLVSECLKQLKQRTTTADLCWSECCHVIHNA